MRVDWAATEGSSGSAISVCEAAHGASGPLSYCCSATLGSSRDSPTIPPHAARLAPSRPSWPRHRADTPRDDRGPPPPVGSESRGDADDAFSDGCTWTEVTEGTRMADGCWRIEAGAVAGWAHGLWQRNGFGSGVSGATEWPSATESIRQPDEAESSWLQTRAVAVGDYGC